MKPKKSPVYTGLFILFSLCLAGCPSRYQKLSSSPVIKVNDHVLTTKEFSNQLGRQLRNFDALAAKDPNNIVRIKEDILRNFLVKSLTLDWARSQNITISEVILDKEVTKLRANYPDDLSFRRELAHEGISFSEWREDLRYYLLERELFKRLNEKVKSPSDAEIKSYYEEHKERFKKKEQVYLRQIVVDQEAKADAVKLDLKKNEMSLLAKKYSITPEGKSGGVVGWIEKGTVDYFDPLFTAGSGVQSIKSPFGFHIIRVEKKLAATTSPLDEVRAQIIRALLAQREQAEYIAWLDAQVRSSKVLRDDNLLNSLRIDTRGAND